MQTQVDAIMSAYAAGKYVEAGGIVEESGWSVTLPSGRTVTRSFLQRHAKPLVALGPEALEPLIAWVARAPDAASRYVAIYALEQLSGRHPRIGHLSPPDGGTLAAAAAEWRAGVAR